MLGSIAITLTIPTSAPPSAVWAALEAAPRWPQVLDDLAEARIEPDGVLAAGAVMRVKAKPGTQAIDMIYDVVAAEKPRRLSIKAAAAGHFRSRAEYTIEPDGNGARVTFKADAEPVRWLHKITTALARRWYTDRLNGAAAARMRAMLTLAERIAQERAAPPG